MKNLIKNKSQSFKYLPLEESDLLFENLWKNVQKEIIKFEGLQEYNDDDTYNYYQNKQYTEMINDLVNFWKNEIPNYYNNVIDNKISFFRLHSVDYPLTAYLESEYYSYLISEQLGEQIKIIDRSKIDNGLCLVDFVMFDDKAIMITDYDENNNPVGDWYCKDKNVIKKIRKEYFELFNKANDFHSMFDSNKKLEEKLMQQVKCLIRK